MGNFPYYSTRSSGQVPFDFRNRAFAPPAFTLVPNAETGEVTAIDPNLRLPLVYEWNTAVEEALGPNQSLSVTYVGAHGMHLLREDTIVKGSTGIWVFATHNADWSNYNALQVQFQRRMSRGLQALVSYTLAKSEDRNSLDVCACSFASGQLTLKLQF